MKTWQVVLILAAIVVVWASFADFSDCRKRGGTMVTPQYGVQRCDR